MKPSERDPVSAATIPIPIVESADRLASLFAAHYRRVLLAAYRVTGNMADAEDVAQGVFLRLRGREESAPSNEASYFYRAAINGALDLLRRRKLARPEPLEAAAQVVATHPGDLPERGVAASELRRLLREAIGALPARAAEMFTLRYIEDMSNAEIAHCMETSQAVVAVTLHQARTKLRKRLNELERGMR